jgi:glycosyltransferase involved in cell wall biosynthesis
LSSVPPRVVVGLPLYDASSLAPSLESLLAQTYRDFAVVVCDDGPEAQGRAVVARHVSERVSYEHNGARLGLTANWRRTFARARERHGQFSYFAWASDHDVWTSSWLASLVQALDAAPDAVLAWPQTVGIDDEGRQLDATPAFDTASIPSRRARFATAVLGVPAGDMVYGVFRADALERCGVFADVLLPDRLLLAELALLGTFRHVPEATWHRRHRAGVVPSRERQLASFFPAGPPRVATLPWPLQHSFAFLRTMGPVIGRVRTAFYSAYLFALASVYYVRSRP